MSTRDVDYEDLATQLLSAAVAGEPLDLRSDDASLNDPEHGADWGSERTVPATLLIELATAPQSAGRSVRKVWLRGARLRGAVDLEGAQALCPRSGGWRRVGLRGGGSGSQESQRRQRCQRTPPISRTTTASEGRSSAASVPISSCPRSPHTSSS